MLSGLDTLFTTDWYKNLVVEIILNFITPYPFGEGLFYYTNYDTYNIKV
jgi:hypothetical protein